MQPILICGSARVSIEELKILFGEHPELAAVRKELAHQQAHVLLGGLHASARALALAHMKAPLFVIFDNAEAAQYIYADLRLMAKGEGQEANVGFFPAAQRRRTIDEAATLQRTETLTALVSENVEIVVS